MKRAVRGRLGRSPGGVTIGRRYRHSGGEGRKMVFVYDGIEHNSQDRFVTEMMGLSEEAVRQGESYDGIHAYA